MAPTEQLEIETKYDVDEHAMLPALHELPGVATVAQPVELELVAVYFDTADFDLAAAGVTLRRRTGGEDDGWHAKFPASSGGRLEIRHPLGRAVRRVPMELVRTVRVHVRDRELRPVVTLTTRRLVHRLLDADGQVLAEVSEDQVTAEISSAEISSAESSSAEISSAEISSAGSSSAETSSAETSSAGSSGAEASGSGASNATTAGATAADATTADATTAGAGAVGATSSGAEAGTETQSWREWEVELVAGTTDLLTAAEPLLRAAGAQPAEGPSKLARALGDRVPRSEEWVLPGKPTSAEVFRAYAAAQVAAIHQRDPEVRRDKPDSIHKLRVATRRLRSALATYRPVIDREAGDRIRDELKWLAGELGPARDAEVLADRLVALVAAEPTELVMGRVAGAIDDQLRAASQTARADAVEVLESKRYFRLLDSLDQLIVDPPSTDSPRKAAKQLPELLRHDWLRLRKAVRRMEKAADPAEGQHELHEVRKAAKRLRYAAESAEPVLGDEAGRLAAQAEQVQEVLGGHQDSVVARDLLRRLAVQVQLDGGNAFTFGRLHALEQLRGEATEREFLQLWPTFTFPKPWR